MAGNYQSFDVFFCTENLSVFVKSYLTQLFKFRFNVFVKFYFPKQLLLLSGVFIHYMVQQIIAHQEN